MKGNKFLGKLYDIVGGLIILAIICGCILCCSSSARNGAKELYNWAHNDDSVTTITSNNDTVKVDTSKTAKSSHIVANVDTIPLIKDDDGNYWVNAQINGIPMRFILDTGCTGITITKIGYLYLAEQGIVAKNDKLSVGQSSLANGETVDHYNCTLPSLTIGKTTIKDIKCTFFNEENAEPLLGQSILASLGDVTIKYKQNLLLIEH